MGAIQFTVPGSLTNHSRSSAGKVTRIAAGLAGLGDAGMFSSQAHENSVTFEVSQQRSFERFHQTVIEQMKQLNHVPDRVTATYMGLADELRELKSLFDDGILTEDEFAEAKQAVIRRSTGQSTE